MKEILKQGAPRGLRFAGAGVLSLAMLSGCAQSEKYEKRSTGFLVTCPTVKPELVAIDGYSNIGGSRVYLRCRDTDPTNDGQEYLAGAIGVEHETDTDMVTDAQNENMLQVDYSHRRDKTVDVQFIGYPYSEIVMKGANTIVSLEVARG